MKLITKTIISILLFAPTIILAEEHNHSHNHFSPTLERSGDDIIGLTVCYKNGYLSDEDQEPAFKNLIKHAGATGEELGMYYMDSLGAKAEGIMADDESRALWTNEFCDELTQTYLDEQKLQAKNSHSQHHNSNHGHGILSPEIVEQDIQRGRLLSIN